MSETCPTVRVVSEASPEGFVSINVADYDPAVHQLLEGEEDTVEAALLDQFAGVSRAALIEMAVAEFRLDIAEVCDDELRHGLISHRRNRAELAKAEAAEAKARDPLDRDGDGVRGGDLPDGWELVDDGPAVRHTASGQTMDSADALRAAIADGWNPDEDEHECLLGSSVLPAIVEVGAVKVQLGGLVAASQRESGLSVADWNAEDEPTREARLQATLDRLSGDPEAAAAEIDAASILPPAEVQETVETTDGPVEIPADWQDAHWTQIVKLAGAIKGSDGADEVKTKDDAIAVVNTEIARRAAAADSTGEA